MGEFQEPKEKLDSQDHKDQTVMLDSEDDEDKRETPDSWDTKERLDHKDQREPEDFQDTLDHQETRDQRESQEPTDNKEIQEMLDHQDFQDHPPSHHGWEAVSQTEPPREEMKERSHFQRRKVHPHQRSEYQRTTHSSKSTDTTPARRSMMRRTSWRN